MKGILLAGGKGTRLGPNTIAVNKHLLAVYDKPLIYYSLSTLMLAGCNDICIVVNPSDLSTYQKLLGNGSSFGIQLKYVVQKESGGIAQGLILARDFLEGKQCFLALGDNIFFGPGLSERLKSMVGTKSCILGYQVADPRRFGVAEINQRGKVLSIEEKPIAPKSNLAVVGLYYYTSRDIHLVSSLKPSNRGELEITDLNNLILHEAGLNIKTLGRGFYWADTGTSEALFEAGQFVRTMQLSQNYLIGSPHEIAYRMNWITQTDLRDNLKQMQHSKYSETILEYVEGENDEN